MLTITISPDVTELHAKLTEVLEGIRAGIPERLGMFGESLVQDMKDQPPLGHPPGGPHPGSREELPVYGEHAYIDRTGRLTASIKSAVVTPTRLHVMAGEGIDYAEKVEYGTPRSRPYPFFWPVIWNRTGQGLYEDYLAGGVREVFYRVFTP